MIEMNSSTGVPPVCFGTSPKSSNCWPSNPYFRVLTPRFKNTICLFSDMCINQKLLQHHEKPNNGYRKGNPAIDILFLFCGRWGQELLLLFKYRERFLQPSAGAKCFNSLAFLIKACPDLGQPPGRRFGTLPAQWYFPGHTACINFRRFRCPDRLQCLWPGDRSGLHRL